MAAAWYDLSHPIRTGMTVGGEKLEVRLSAHVGVSPGGDRIHTTGIAMNTHSGTHIDVPFHFAEDGARLQQLPVERFIGTSAVVDVPGAECREVTVADVGDVIEAIGPDDTARKYRVVEKLRSACGVRAPSLPGRGRRFPVHSEAAKNGRYRYADAWSVQVSHAPRTTCGNIITHSSPLGF